MYFLALLFTLLVVLIVVGLVLAAIASIPNVQTQPLYPWIRALVILFAVFYIIGALVGFFPILPLVGGPYRR